MALIERLYKSPRWRNILLSAVIYPCVRSLAIITIGGGYCKIIDSCKR